MIVMIHLQVWDTRILQSVTHIIITLSNMLINKKIYDLYFKIYKIYKNFLKNLYGALAHAVQDLIGK